MTNLHLAVAAAALVFLAGLICWSAVFVRERSILSHIAYAAGAFLVAAVAAALVLLLRGYPLTETIDQAAVLVCAIGTSAALTSLDPRALDPLRSLVFGFALSAALAALRTGNWPLAATGLAEIAGPAGAAAIGAAAVLVSLPGSQRAPRGFPVLAAASLGAFALSFLIVALAAGSGGVSAAKSIGVGLGAGTLAAALCASLLRAPIGRTALVGGVAGALSAVLPNPILQAGLGAATGFSTAILLRIWPSLRIYDAAGVATALLAAGVLAHLAEWTLPGTSAFQSGPEFWATLLGALLGGAALAALLRATAGTRHESA